MRYVLFSLLILLIPVQLSAQKSLLYGKAVDFSTKEISFYTISDPILNQKSELATTTIASDGTFSVLLPITQTIEIYTDLEKYCGTMVVEPGKNYQITLPPFSPRTSEEAHSIYFKPAPYWLGLPGTDNSDLNFTVRSFVTDFNLETVRNGIQIYQQRSKEVVTEIIDRLEKKYSRVDHPYFQILKKYSFAELESRISQKNNELIIRKYFATQPIALTNPGYQKAFETIFTDFLRMQAQDIQNNKIVSITDSGNYLDLVAYFETRGYTMEFSELVVLKGLYDGYYTGRFSKEGVVRAIGMAQSATSSPVLQDVANRIKIKLSHLAVGGKAPSIWLKNLKMEQVSLEQFKGKFVYLTFINSSSADCRAELDLIASLEKRFREVLNVVSIAVDDDFKAPTELWKAKKYAWELLDGSNQKLLISNYNATITPAFYLIAPDGNLRLSQAPSPSHGFEPIFLKIIRDHNFRRKPSLTF